MKSDQRARIRLMPRIKHRHHYDTIVRIKGTKVRYGCDTCPDTDSNWYRPDDIQAIAGVARLAGPVAASLKRMAKALQPLSDAMKNTGWLSGSGGSDSDPQGAPGVFLINEGSWTTDQGVKQDLSGGTIQFPVQDASATSDDQDQIDRYRAQTIEQVGRIYEVSVDMLGLPNNGIQSVTPVDSLDVPDTGCPLCKGSALGCTCDSETEESLSKISVDVLRKMAATYNIDGRSKMKKAELITALLKLQESR